MAIRRPASSALLEEARAIVARHHIQHVGFILDGNRRWAARRGLGPAEGYRRALHVVLDRTRDAAAAGIGVVSFWVFSTENWRRGPNQVDAVFDVAREVRDRIRRELLALGARFHHIGRADRLPEDLLTFLADLEDATKGNRGIRTLAAFDYGGQDEVIRAISRAIAAGRPPRSPGDLAQFLDTAGIPDPDIVVRTSGEVRTSGFMIWQSAYSEWIFTRTLGPEFRRRQFVAALRAFSQRQRRFGGD